jgi:hypothetical protein
VRNVMMAVRVELDLKNGDPVPSISVKFLHASRGSDALKASTDLCNVQLRTLHKRRKCNNLLTSVGSGKERYMLKGGQIYGATVRILYRAKGSHQQQKSSPA